MAKEKEIKKDTEKKEVEKKETKKFNIKKLVKRIAKKIATATKKLVDKTKDYIRFHKNQVVRTLTSLGILVAVVIIAIIAKNIIVGAGIGNIGYPIIYQKSNNDIYMLEHGADVETKKQMEKINGTGYVEYSNTTNRYALFKNGEDLYMYDMKKDETTKISDDVTVYGFSDKDSYVYMIDSSNDLYAYNFKDSKELLDNTIDLIQDYNDKAVIYSKNYKLYYISFDPAKEDKKELVNEYKLAELSEDGKNVIYTNSNNVLYRYEVKKDKHHKIASNVDIVKCENKSCTKLYYTTSTENYSLHYYDGKESTTLTDEVYQLIKTDAENQRVIYTVINNNDLTLKYIHKNKKPVTVTTDYDYESSVVVIDDSLYYVNSKSELIYRKINGSSLGKEKVISKEVQGSLNEYASGVYFYKKVNEDNDATFYVAEKDKVTKIGDDIRITSPFLSNDKETIYYLKEVDKHIGTLMYFDGKDSTKISEGVYEVSYVKDGGIYYIADYDNESKNGTLYRYDGKKEKIDTTVTYLVMTTPNQEQNK